MSQMQTIQNKITRHGCSCGFNAGCKNVKPAMSNNSASASRNSIALRRMFWSRITPRVACTTKDVVSKSFFSGGFSIEQFARDARWLLIDLTIQIIQDNRLLRNNAQCFHSMG